MEDTDTHAHTHAHTHLLDSKDSMMSHKLEVSCHQHPEQITVTFSGT